MPKFIIERELPGAGKLSAQEMQSISKKSCEVLHEMGPNIQWIESYVTDNKLYCVYLATDANLIKQHASKGGFPANYINEVRTMISPLTAE